MTTAAMVRKPEYTPPPINGDYYFILDCLDEKERAIARRVRDFAEKEVAPIITDFWARDEFPHEIVPKLPALDFAGVGYKGYGSAGGSWLLNGIICMDQQYRERNMAESVYKIIEVVGTSPESWEKAAAAVVNRAAKTLRDLRVAEIVQLDMQISDGKVEAYRAKVRLSFKFED